MEKINTKPFWQSSTLWINIIPVVTLILDVVIKSEIIPDADVVLLITAVLNILNRFRKVEKKGLSIK